MDVVKQQLTNITVNSARQVSAHGVILKNNIYNVLDVDQSMFRLQEQNWKSDNLWRDNVLEEELEIFQERGGGQQQGNKFPKTKHSQTTSGHVLYS